MTNETWESICDIVESIIKYGQVASKRRWSYLVTLFTYLDLPLLDPIDKAMPPKLKLEEIESDFDKTKKHILEITQLTMEKIKQLIARPLISLMSIDLFLK